jgi:hypothetical protein
MKKIIILLVVLIGFGISTYADDYVNITNVKYNSSLNSMEVTVSLKQAGKGKIIDFKVFATNTDIVKLFAGETTKYGSICNSSNNCGNYTTYQTVYLECAENADKSKLQACRAYDWDVTTTDVR